MNLNITQIFPNFTLTAAAATKAALANAIEAAGANDADSFTIDLGGTTTIVTLVSALGGAAATEIQVVRSGTATTDRDRLRKAINGTEDTNVGYGSSLDAAEGVQGVKAANGTGTTLSLEAETAGASTITLANATGTVATAGADTGTDASGTANIPLSDLSLTENDFTLAEGGQGGGDYRKFGYHFVRKLFDYLKLQESVASITITAGGAGYSVGDVLVFSGGSPTRVAAAAVSTIDGNGAITGVTISDAGEGYDSTPAISVTSSTATSTATLSATLTDLLPANFGVTRSGVSEIGDQLRRTYNVQIDFSEGGLEVAPES